MAKEGAVAKSEIISKFRLRESDTGSPEVQIALLTNRLEALSKHFQKHPQDKHSKQGLLEVVSKRKRILDYLRGEDISRYRSIISTLGLRK